MELFSPWFRYSARRGEIRGQKASGEDTGLTGMQTKKGKGQLKDLPASDELLGVNSQIANQLRAFYISIQEEEIPEKFLTLLEKLDQAEAQSQSHHKKKVSNE